MIWNASIVRGGAVVWAVVLIAAFVVFTGVGALMPSTKSGRIHSPRDSGVNGVPVSATVEATTRPAQ